MIQDVNMAQLEQILKDDKTVVIDFWAPWCGPCTNLMPIVEDLASRHSEKIAVVKVNISDYPDLASVMEVVSIPNLQCLKHGKKIGEKVGFMTLEDIEAWLRELNVI